MKQKLQTMLTAKNARKAEIVKGIEACDSVDEIKRFSAELEGLNAEIRDLEAMIANIPDETEARTAAVTETPEIVKTQSNTERKAPAEVKTHEKVYRTLGEQLTDIRSAASGNAAAQERLNRSADGMNTQTGEDGGYLIQADFAQAILESVVEQSPLMQLVDRYTVSANANEVYWPTVDEEDTDTVFGGVKAYWTDEGEAYTPSQPKLKQIRVPLKKLTCLAYVTDEQMRDASFTGAMLTRAFGLAIARSEEEKLITDVIANAGTVTIAKESGQAAASVMGENLMKMRNALLPTSRKNSVWVMHPDVMGLLPSIYLAGAHSDNFVYMPAGGLSVDGYDKLFARNVMDIDFCSQLGAKGDILLLDPKEYLWIEKGGIETATSIHVKFESGQQAFRATYRANGVCKRNKQVSIKNSTTKRSAYVTLAARA